MPMPQRNSRRVAQLLSNNSSVLSGIGTTQTGLNNFISNQAASNNNNSAISSSIISPSSNSTSGNSSNAGVPANGRLYGNPAAQAQANTIQQQQQHQAPPPPPLITDTLTACLDVNGTYICTSYSPRCYIIQKVTPNTVTVTPHVIGGGGETQPTSPSTATTSGTCSSPNVGHTSLVPILPAAAASSSSSPNSLIQSGVIQRKQTQNPTKHSELSLSSSPPSSQFLSSSITSHQSAYTAFHNRHFQSLNSTNNHGSQNIVRNPNYAHLLRKGESETGSRTYSAATLSSQTGRAYMNGEVGSTVTTFVGEESTPAMVHQSSSSGAGTQLSENRSLNGVKDGPGMSRELMKPIENNEFEGADISRRNDPGNGANPGALDLSREELKRQLLLQLEYYFSPENLANDKFLVSQMDSDHYVFISTIANFNLVKRLTGDVDLVTEALRDSKNVQVHSDGKRVRPVSHRTVVILRGIPESTPVDEIKALFDSENCPKCNSCEFAFNDSWYVSFESDEDAQRAHRYLREDVKEFKGQPIMARIKSRPTTLLAQGAGVHLKNGFHQPAQVVGAYIPPAAFVPGSQTGPTSAVAPTPMFPHSQTVPPVFPIPPNYTYGPWTNYYGMGPDQISQIFPVNGLPPQHQTSSSYSKSLPMNPRPRNPNQVRPRRPLPSSDNQGMNGVVAASGTNSAVAAHQTYGTAPARKSTAAGAGAGGPPPLLNIVPNTPTVSLVNPTSHNHSQGHLPHSTVQVGGGNAISQNGSRNYGGTNLPSSHSLDSYHPTGSMRPYRGVNDSRPRSSLSNRKGPTMRREEEASYDGPSASPALPPNKVPSARGAPPNVPAVQPPPPPENLGTQQQQPPGKINFDLEGSAFPPLPGSGFSAGKNGDAVFEGRLSDVVKGVKNMKASGSEKEDAKATGGGIASTEIIVSVEDQCYGEVREVSAASPIKDLELEKKAEQSSSQSSPSVQGGKKEFREVGVGSADDTHDIRSSHYNVVGGARNKETADKSTRTDEALLNGDQSQGVKTGSTQTPSQTQNGNRRSAGVGVGPSLNKSPIPGKRAVPATHGHPQQQATSTVSVGPEVPYSSRTTAAGAYTSPVQSPIKPIAVTASQTQTQMLGSGGAPSANSQGRGANPYVAKQGDNNNSRANGLVSSASNQLVNDKDAFPSPGFGKPVPTTCKPFPNSSDQTPKEVSRTDTDKDRKESGQGDAKKNEDCSSEERDGPVRLSYAQVAQARKEVSGAGVNHQQSLSGSSVGNCVNSAASGYNSASTQSSMQDDKRRPNPKDTKDVRPPLKNQRGPGGGPGGDRDGRFRRGFRNRMSSDHSDAGSDAGGRRPAKPSRSPK